MAIEYLASSILFKFENIEPSRQTVPERLDCLSHLQRCLRPNLECEQVRGGEGRGGDGVG